MTNLHNLFYWNVRGTDNTESRSRIKKWVKEYKLDIVCVGEPLKLKGSVEQSECKIVW